MQSKGFNPNLPVPGDPHPLTAQALERKPPPPEVDHGFAAGATASANPLSRFAQTVEQILEYLEEGNTRPNAARLVGLHPDTVTDWVHKGNKDPEKYPEYAWYAEEEARIKAWVQHTMVGEIIATAKSGRPNTWQAAAWYLERSDPENWARRDKVKVENTGDAPLIQLNQVIITDDDAFRASRDLLSRLAAGSTVESIGSGSRGELASGREYPED